MTVQRQLAADAQYFVRGEDGTEAAERILSDDFVRREPRTEICRSLAHVRLARTIARR